MDLQEQKTEILRKIKSNEYSTKLKILGNGKRQKTSNIWNKLHEIWDGDDLVKGFVFCPFCNNVLRYDSKTTGTSSLNSHLNLHESANNAPKITTIFRPNCQITQSDKNKVINASLDLVIDLRPFETVAGEAMISFVQVIWDLGAKYGPVNAETIQSVMPCPTTLSRRVKKNAIEAKKGINELIENNIQNNGMAITLDLWTDSYKRVDYLAMTGHFYKETHASLELMDIVLCMQPLDAMKKKMPVIFVQ